MLLLFVLGVLILSVLRRKNVSLFLRLAKIHSSTAPVLLFTPIDKFWESPVIHK
jgi:hypothetical protein